MEPGFRRLLEEVLKENIVSQTFNELLIETGINLESPEWDAANKMLEMADEILLSLGGNKGIVH